MQSVLLQKTNLKKLAFICTAWALLLSCKKDNTPAGSNPSPTPDPVVVLPPSAQKLTPKPVKLSAHCWGFYEYLPEGYFSDPSTSKYPLLLFFHGGGEIGEDSAGLSRLLRHGPLKHVVDGSFPKSFTVNGREHKFIILAPQFVSSGNAYPGEIESILEYAKQNYRVDPSRIYLTGLSFGGGLCWNYVGNNTSYARKVAAMVPIAAYINETRPEFKVDAAKAGNIASSGLPVWSTHNSGDNTCPLSWVVNAHALVSNSNPAPDPLPRLTIFNSNAHGGWTQTYNPSFKENGLNIYEWMLQYHR